LEANVLVDGRGVVEELEGFFDELFEGGRAKHISTIWLDSYRELWKEQQAARTKLDRRRAASRVLSAINQHPIPVHSEADRRKGGQFEPMFRKLQPYTSPVYRDVSSGSPPIPP